MKLRNFGFSTYIGLGIIIFVTLVGALGYTYVMSSKSEVASHDSKKSQTNTIAAETISIPEIKESADLSIAVDTLDQAGVDTLSLADIDTLEAELDNL